MLAPGYDQTGISAHDRTFCSVRNGCGTQVKRASLAKHPLIPHSMPPMPIGVAGPTAFVWGDVSPAPSGARRIEIRAGNTSVQGFLIPSAHEVDMGQLAPGIHNVVMVGCDDRGLYGSHPSGPGRHRIEFGAADGELEREAREIFGFVSLMPGDVSEGVTSGQVLSLLKELPSRVRYAVMALPG